MDDKFGISHRMGSSKLTPRNALAIEHGKVVRLVGQPLVQAESWSRKKK
jgi:hypothetical protein